MAFSTSSLFLSPFHRNTSINLYELLAFFYIFYELSVCLSSCQFEMSFILHLFACFCNLFCIIIIIFLRSLDPSLKRNPSLFFNFQISLILINYLICHLFCSLFNPLLILLLLLLPFMKSLLTKVLLLLLWQINKSQ